MHRTGAVFILGSAVAFGSMTIFGKLAYEAGVGVLTLLLLRFAIAAPILWGLALYKRAARPPGRRALLGALGLGAVGYALQSGLAFLALERMDASLLTMVIYTFPAFVTAAAIALGRETANRRRIGALLVSSSGLALVLAGAGAGTFDWVGAAMGIGAALTYTAYILVSDRVTGTIDPLPLAALVTTGAAATFAIAGLASGSLDAGFAHEGWIWLVSIALVSTVASIVLFFAGLQRVGPSSAAILSTVEPPTTVALAFVAFGETLTLLQLLGAVLVLGAVILINVRPAAPATA